MYYRVKTYALLQGWGTLLMMNPLEAIVRIQAIQFALYLTFLEASAFKGHIV